MNFCFKKPKTKTALIIAGIILFVLIVPNTAQGLLSGTDIAQSILEGFSHVIFSFFSMFVDLAARFLEAMLNIGFASHKEVTEIGWKVVRDFSNMFFILFMVVIAFATILRIERYGIKELLPKVIIIALLINFSLVICYVIIDFSDIAANYFINNAKQGLSGRQSIAAVLRDGFKQGEVIIPVDCDTMARNSTATCDAMSDEDRRNTCINETRINYGNCRMGIDKIRNETESFVNMIISMVAGSIILMIAAFILFVGGILILVRLFFLWFLVMIVPVVFLCYLMPGLRSNWQKWWKSFLSWCFFAPIYTFFIWLAVKLIQEKTIDQTIGVSADATGNQTLGTAFFGTTDNLIAYLFTAALLIGGLIAAKQLGIYGASTAMVIGQKWGRAAASKAARYPKEIGTAITGQAVKSMGKGFQKLPGFKAFGERMEARGKIIAAKPLKAKELEKIDEMAKYMTPEQIAHQIKTSISGAVTQKFAQAAIAQGKFNKMDSETKRIAANTFRAYGDIKAANEIEQRDPNIVKTKTERQDAYKKGRVKGYHRDYTAETFKGTDGQEFAKDVVALSITIGDFVKTFKDLKEDAQEQLLKTMETNFNDNFDRTTIDGQQNIKNREAYAAATGKAVEAFKDPSGMLRNTELKVFVENMKPTDFAELDKGSLPEVAKHITSSAAAEIGRYLSGAMKENFANELKKDPTKKAELSKLPGWASYMT